MTPTTAKELPKPIVTFIDNLAKLDDGDRAQFKRNAGNRLVESNRVIGLFYNKIMPPGVGQWAEDWYFLVATLYPLEKEPAQTPPPPNLGASLRQVRTDKNSSGLDRRVERLLDADEQQLPFQLRQAVYFLTSQRGRVHWAQLLQDVLNWSLPSRSVQRRWARAYFANESNH